MGVNTFFLLFTNKKHPEGCFLHIIPSFSLRYPYRLSLSNIH